MLVGYDENKFHFERLGAKKIQALEFPSVSDCYHYSTGGNAFFKKLYMLYPFFKKSGSLLKLS